MNRYDKLMPKSEHRQLMLHLAGIHYNNPVETLPLNVSAPREKREKVAKSPSIMVSEKSLTEVGVSTEPVAEVTPDGAEVNPQVITKPENLIDVPEPTTDKKPLGAGQKTLAKSLLKTITKKSAAGTGWTRPAGYNPETGKWCLAALMSLVDSGKIVEKESGIFWVA